MEQQATHPHFGAAQPYPAPPRVSIMDKAKSGCARNPGTAIAIIIVLAVLCVYLYAKTRGWIENEHAGHSASPKHKKTKKSAKSGGGDSKGSQSSSSSDEEKIDHLIETLTN